MVMMMILDRGEHGRTWVSPGRGSFSLSQHFLHLGESSLILIRTGKRAATRKYRSTKRFSSEVDI